MTRTGLAAHVPTLDLCREMRKVPALKAAFADSALVHVGYSLVGNDLTWQVEPQRKDGKGIPAPLVGEMLEYLRMLPSGKVGQAYWVVNVDGSDEPWGITDADDVARACIEAAK
jgi:hypothetical protein